MEVRWLPFAQEQLKVVAQYVIDNFGEMTAKKSLRSILSKVEALGVKSDCDICVKIIEKFCFLHF